MGFARRTVPPTRARPWSPGRWLRATLSLVVGFPSTGAVPLAQSAGLGSGKPAPLVGGPLDPDEPSPRGRSALLDSLDEIGQAVPEHLRPLLMPEFDKPSVCRKAQDMLGVHGSPASMQPRICQMEGAERCPLTGLDGSNYTVIAPGGASTCVGGKPYAFQVWKGSTSKLAIYFQAGGACWNKLTRTTCMCVTDAIASPRVLQDVWEGFEEYTIVHILYCSGDMHLGNAEHGWGKSRGWVNAMSAVNWTKANVDAKLESLVLLGTSAGGVGLSVWSTVLLDLFPAKHSAVVLDSMPAHHHPAAGALPMTLGICPNSAAVSEKVSSMCMAKPDLGELLDEALLATMRRHPGTVFAQIASKVDEIQSFFYHMEHNSMLRALNSFRVTVARDVNISHAAAKHRRRLNQQPNYVSYLVDGTRHGFLSEPQTLERTWPTGQDPGANAGKRLKKVRAGQNVGAHAAPNLKAWLASVLTPGTPKESVCGGAVQPLETWPANKSALTLCDASQAGKRFLGP